jgi:ferric-dicitrate binding protein FerR (iron transport regulator)
MENKKYKSYSVEELLEDQKFVIKVNNIQTNEEWYQFLQSNISAKENIIRARKIIQLFKIYEGKLSDDRKFNLWKNISIYNKTTSRKFRISQINPFLKIAASILIVIALGNIVYLGLNPIEEIYEFSESTGIDRNSTSSFLRLSNGTKVNLADEKSEIVVLKNQDAILINKDSVVANTPVISPDAKQVALNEVTVPFGKKTTLVMADGTKVWLNAGSRFAFPQKFEGNRREVQLDGEAYFEVAKNKDQPFIVSTRNIEVQVLGTKFNLSAYQSDNFSETVLLEGAVNVLDNRKLFKAKLELKPNQKATYYTDKKELIRSEAPDAEMQISWINGWYKFSNQNLIAVLDKLERYYNIRFVHNSTLESKAFPISGKLDLKGSINEVMAVLSKVAKINYQIKENEIIITEKD